MTVPKDPANDNNKQPANDNNKGAAKPEDDKDPRTIAEKDNSGLDHPPPSHSTPSQPQLSPPGMSSVRRPTTSDNEKTTEYEIEFVPEENLDWEDAPKIDMTTNELTIEGQHKNGIGFLVRQEDEGFNQGLGGGRISRLTLIQDGEPTVHYEGKWFFEPETPVQYQTVDHLQDQFGGLERSKGKSRDDPSPEKDPSIDL